MNFNRNELEQIRKHLDEYNEDVELEKSRDSELKSIAKDYLLFSGILNSEKYISDANLKAFEFANRFLMDFNDWKQGVLHPHCDTMLAPSEDDRSKKKIRKVIKRPISKKEEKAGHSVVERKVAEAAPMELTNLYNAALSFKRGCEELYKTVGKDFAEYYVENHPEEGALDLFLNSVRNNLIKAINIEKENDTIYNSVSESINIYDEYLPKLFEDSEFLEVIRNREDYINTIMNNNE